MHRSNLLVDLFCGCGGFSLGAHLAGFQTALAVDIDKTLSSSIGMNFPHSPLENMDLGAVSLSNHSKLGGKRVLGVIGGPPCQGFSAIGKRQETDPRNSLVGHFYRHVSELKPAFFIMENVPGILEAKSRPALEASIATVSKDYEIVGPITVNAADFGAATSRSRVIVLGYRKADCDPITAEDIERIKNFRSATVRQAIDDLPSPTAAAEVCANFEWAPFPERDLATLSDYARAARAAAPNGLGWQVAKERLKLGHITGNQITVHSEEISKRYAAVLGGKRDTVSKSYKLEWDCQCPTLRAGTGPDHGSFNAVRPLHPDEGRVITVREAARIQGFPDWFVFHPTKWHSFRMIGNSVSPYMSYNLLQLVSAKLGLSEAEEAA